MTTNNEDPQYEMYRARLRESLRNERTNPSMSAGTEHAPKAWTNAEVAELMTNRYGTEAERLARLIEGANRRP